MKVGVKACRHQDMYGARMLCYCDIASTFDSLIAKYQHLKVLVIYTF